MFGQDSLHKVSHINLFGPCTWPWFYGIICERCGYGRSAYFLWHV